MNFERLNNSITLNDGEQPSIYMAMCLIESMFKDIEDATGTDLSHVEAGDDQLPTKLIWLSRKLLKIYSEKAAAFERNRSRLDDMMEKVRNQEAELEAFHDVSTAYSQIKEKASALETALVEANACKEETLRLQALCEERSKEIAALKNFDASGAASRLEQLNAIKEELSGQYSKLTGSLESMQGTVSELQKQTEESARLLREAEKQRDALQSEKLAIDRQCEEAENAIGALRIEIASKGEERDHGIADRAYCELRLSELEQEIISCQNDVIAPLKKEIEEKNQLCESIKSEINDLKKERENAVFRTAQMNRQLEDIRLAAQAKREELEKKQEESDLAAKELEAVKDGISTETEKLAALQSEEDELKYTRLPQLRSLIEENETENEELRSVINGLEQRKDELISQNETLRAEETELAKNVDELTAIRSELTATYDAKNEALSELRKNVEALRGKNDREKEQQYRRQLEEEQNKLIELGRICTELEQRIAELNAERESRQAEADSLKQQKDSAEETNRKIGTLIRELAPCGNNELLSRVAALRQRESFLEETRDGISKAVGLLTSAFSIPSESICEDPDRIGELLQRCDKGLDKLQAELLKCANEIKLIEKSEEQI